MSSGLDGTKQRTIATNSGSPRGIAVDLILQRLYWIDVQQELLQSCDYAGKSIAGGLLTGQMDYIGIAGYQVRTGVSPAAHAWYYRGSAATRCAVMSELVLIFYFRLESCVRLVKFRCD